LLKGKLVTGSNGPLAAAQRDLVNARECLNKSSSRRFGKPLKALDCGLTSASAVEKRPAGMTG
jgi:hypothetical protein